MGTPGDTAASRYVGPPSSASPSTPDVPTDLKTGTNSDISILDDGTEPGRDGRRGRGALGPAHLAAQLPRAPGAPRRAPTHQRADRGHGGRPGRRRGRPHPARLGRTLPADRRRGVRHRRRTRRPALPRRLAGPARRPGAAGVGALHRAQRPVGHPQLGLRASRLHTEAVGAHRAEPVRAEPGARRGRPRPAARQHRPAALRRRAAAPRPARAPPACGLHQGPPRPDRRGLRLRDLGRDPRHPAPHHRTAGPLPA